MYLGCTWIYLGAMYLGQALLLPDADGYGPVSRC